MNKLKVLALSIMMFSGVGFADAACFDEGVKSFKLVLDDIYEEIGRSEMTEKIAEQMDRQVFLRPYSKKPALSTKVHTSWSTYKDSITAVISCEENGSLQKQRVLWRPDQDLEILDPDVVLEW